MIRICENIEEMATDYLDDWVQLYQHKLTQFMLESIMEAAKEDFKFIFHASKE